MVKSDFIKLRKLARQISEFKQAKYRAIENKDWAKSAKYRLIEVDLCDEYGEIIAPYRETITLKEQQMLDMDFYVSINMTDCSYNKPSEFFV